MEDVYLGALLFALAACSPFLALTGISALKAAKQRSRHKNQVRAAIEEHLAHGWPDARFLATDKQWTLEIDAQLALEGDYDSSLGVVGRYLLPDGPVFDVRPETFSDSVAKEYGTEDVELGVAPFDEHFMVRASTPETTRSLWSRQAQAFMVRELPEATIASDGETLKLALRGHPMVLLEKVEQMAALFRELLEADLFGGEALRELAGISEHAARPAQVEIVDDGVAVFVGAKMRADRAVTCAWSDRPARRSLAAARENLPPATRELTGGIEEASLQRTACSVALWLATIETDVARLQAAVALVAALVSTSEAPYR